MSPDEMVDATYDAAIGINRVKAEAGIIDQATATRTETRISEARVAMARIDAIMAGPEAAREPALKGLKEEFDRLSQSTVADKNELNWPRSTTLKHVAACAGLFVTRERREHHGRRRGEMSPATSEQPAAKPTDRRRPGGLKRP